MSGRWSVLSGPPDQGGHTDEAIAMERHSDCAPEKSWARQPIFKPATHRGEM